MSEAKDYLQEMYDLHGPLLSHGYEVKEVSGGWELSKDGEKLEVCRCGSVLACTRKRAEIQGYRHLREAGA